MEEPTAKDLYPSAFSRVAAMYKQRLDEVMARSASRGRAAVIDWVDPRPGKRILDLACGPGALTYRLARDVSPGGEAVGIDLAPGMIELAGREAPAGLPVRFELMDMEDLRFPDGSFDAATCGHGLSFVPDLLRALTEARRVIKPGSRMAASVPVDPDALSDAQAILERAVGTELPPAPKARDQFSTRRTVEDERAFAHRAARRLSRSPRRAVRGVDHLGESAAFHRCGGGVVVNGGAPRSGLRDRANGDPGAGRARPRGGAWLRSAADRRRHERAAGDRLIL